MHLILASTSPRRRRLMSEAGYQFEVIAPQAEENPGLCSNCGPAELVVDLAQQKAADVVHQLLSRSAGPSIVVACDTVAECGGQILGKPADEVHAREMLAQLSGTQHRVYSGLCVWPLPDGLPETSVVITSLTMDPLSETEVDEYLRLQLWEGKAGAFGYQDGLDWVHIVEGSETNVVGLPMEQLAEMLKPFGSTQ